MKNYVNCASTTKHFHYLIGKYCIDNKIPIHKDTWERVSKWENDFGSTLDERYVYLTTSEGEVCGTNNSKNEEKTFEQFILILKEELSNHPPRFRDWSIEYMGDKISFGCGEVILTKEEIKGWLKIHKILDQRDIQITLSDIDIIERMVINND